MKIYHNSNCSKSNGSCQLLNDHKVDYEVVEYLKTPPTKEEIKKLLVKLDTPAFELIRKGEDIYKEYYAGKTLTEGESIDAMCKYPILIQRPIIVDGDRAVIGRPISLVIDLIHTRND